MPSRCTGRNGVDVSALDAKPVALQQEWLLAGCRRLAAETGNRVVMTGGIGLKPGKSHAASCVSGPFRFAEREVLAKIDAEQAGRVTK